MKSWITVTAAVFLCLAAHVLERPVAAEPSPAPVIVTVEPGIRQTFHGFGASALNFGREYQTLAPQQRLILSRTLWHDLHFQTLRLWFNTDQYAPTLGTHDMTTFRGNYVDSGLIADARAQGVTTLLLAPDNLPPYMAEKSALGSADTGMALKPSATDDYADLLADFLGRLKQETGIVPDVTGVQNEPNDRERFTPAQIVEVVKRLRSDLDGRGLSHIQIIAPEQANADAGMVETAHALRADPVA
jgi:O-glycosyl hydrolase